MRALHLLLFLFRRGLFGLLDQRQHVTHAKDPRRHPIGMEDLELVELLADRCELDRLAGDRLDRERGTAARVAVELRQQDAVECDPLLEGGGDVDCLLARHRVEDEQDVRRLQLISELLELVHQLGVDLQAAGSVDDDDVPPLGSRLLEAELCRLDGIVALAREDRDLNLLAELFELSDRGRTLQIGRDQRGGSFPPCAASARACPLRSSCRSPGVRRAGSRSAGVRRRPVASRRRP